MIKSFNFLIATALIAIVAAIPIIGHIWYETPITETADVSKFGIGAIAFCFLLFKYKE
tara:strand:- start:780 stop:953 length:174 start_codon:yes stop_codon:yes gene_type:complete